MYEYHLLKTEIDAVTTNGEQLERVQEIFADNYYVNFYYNNNKIVRINVNTMEIVVFLKNEYGVLNEIETQEQNKYITNQERDILCNPILNLYLQLPTPNDKPHCCCSIL